MISRVLAYVALHSTGFPDTIDWSAASNADSVANTCASGTGNKRLPSIASTNASSSARKTSIAE
jgi:hypothetical protein